tara:strand:+ start:3239 stop:3718 length:480 start_codon:yes stop_codon:yes gene_type:complete
MAKISPSYNDIHNIVKEISNKLAEYKPDVIIAISGGGLIPARIMRTYIEKPVFTVGFRLYDKNDKMMETIKKTQWLDNEVIKQFINGKTVLIVDEVDDTRTTLYHCVEELKKYSTPKNIIVSVIHNKLKLKRHVLTEDIIYIPGKETGDEWIVYPWDCK